MPLLHRGTVQVRVPTLLESPGFFGGKISRSWKVLENGFGPGKSWKFECKVLESPGIF